MLSKFARGSVQRTVAKVPLARLNAARSMSASLEDTEITYSRERWLPLTWRSRASQLILLKVLSGLQMEMPTKCVHAFFLFCPVTSA
jgi:hypothetical protein